MYRADRKEPFWWGMFSAGGVLAALLVPIHILIDGLAVPLGLIDAEKLGYESMHQLAGSLPFRIYLFALVVLPLYHAAHRVRFSLYELGMREFRVSMHILCYGAALALTVVAAYVLFLMH